LRDREQAFIPDPEPVKLVLVKIDDNFFNRDVETLIAELDKAIRDERDRALAGPLGKMDAFENTLAEYNEQMAELQNSLAGLKNNTYLELKKLHEEELFPRMERNVDNYLNWYYSITGEYVRLGNLVAGNIEDHMKGKLNEYLTKDVSFQKANAMMKRFSDESVKIAAQIAAIESLTKQTLEHVAAASEEFAQISEQFQSQWDQAVDVILTKNKVAKPEDMAAVEITREYASMDDFLESYQDISVELSSVMERFEVYTKEVRDLLKIFAHHKDENISFNTRMTGASAVGTFGAAIGARIAVRIAGKQVFKTAAAAVGKMVVKRGTGIGTGAGAGAAGGAAIGSVVPGVGTVIGAVVGGVAGAAGAWLATDYVFVKLEEQISRESFKREILSGVNEQKGEVMMALENIFHVNKTPADQSLNKPDM
jgi:hypothetical protein